MRYCIVGSCMSLATLRLYIHLLDCNIGTYYTRNTYCKVSDRPRCTADTTGVLKRDAAARAANLAGMRQPVHLNVYLPRVTMCLAASSARCCGSDLAVRASPWCSEARTCSTGISCAH